MRHALLALLLAAASGAAHADSGLSWLSGCWRSDDNSYRETWTRPDSGFLFGYAFAYTDGQISFFEQSRIEGGERAKFSAYPNGFGPTEFLEESRGRNAIVFINPSNDYPQRIAYERSGRRMTATVSLLNGAREQRITMRRC